MYAEAAKAADSAAPPVKIGPVTVSAQVTVTYIYDPRRAADARPGGRLAGPGTDRRAANRPVVA